MTQATLFDSPRRSALDDLFADLDGDGSRWYQREAVDSFHRELQTNRSTLAVMATGLGKCLGRGTQVMLFDGTTLPVEMVMPGDLLMGPDSKPRRVLSTTQGIGPLFEIRPTKGDPWVCNWCHVLTLKHTETGEIIDVSLDEYLTKTKNFKHLHKQFSVGVDFEECTIPEVNPYVFGLWLGDGTKNLASFCISKPDPEVRAALDDFAAGWNASVTTVERDGKCPGHYVSAGKVGRAGFPLLKVMRQLFADGGIPHAYLTGTRDDRLQLLAGLLDSDGYYADGCFEIAQRSTKIADGVCFLARSLGFKVTRCVKTVNGTDYQRMVISGELSAIPNRIPRKKAAPRGINKDALRTGFSVHPLGDGDYYGFTLDGDGRFLLGDFTVTHNTFCFSMLAREWDKGPVLVIAHRDELIQQAKESLERMVGDYVDIEQATEQSSFRSKFVVGSIQSLAQKKRLERLGHERFSLIIVDESHHSTASSYKKVLDWFGPAKVLGVTATPDRSDEKALGAIFDSVAYVFDIEQGIDAGYLVPLRGRHIDVEQVDLSGVKTKAGDLADGDLDEVMVNAVSGIVHETLRLEPDRQAVAFFPGIRSAELAAQTFNERRPGSACYVDGTTDKDLRRELLKDFKSGRYMYFCNCGIATEGFDAPQTAMIIHGRPTKSRALYAQMTGRGTRTLPGVIDPFSERDGLRRRGAIASSQKPDCLLLDFVANSGKHDLVTPEDLLGGSYTDEEVELAKKARKKGQGGDVKTELEKAHAELARLAAVTKAAKVTAKVRDFDPFRALRIDMEDEKRYARFGSPMSNGQWTALSNLGVPEEDLRAMSRRGASKLLDEMSRRRKADLCSYKQARWLSKYGVDPTGVTFKRASEALDYIFTNRKNGTPVNGAALHSLLTRERLPGED